jgi:hypothetical protein
VTAPQDEPSGDGDDVSALLPRLQLVRPRALHRAERVGHADADRVGVHPLGAEALELLAPLSAEVAGVVGVLGVVGGVVGAGGVVGHGGER